MTTFFTRMPSPAGDLLLSGDEGELTALWIDGQRWAPAIGDDWRPAAEPFAEAMRQLQEYFAGERIAFDLSLRLNGTPFQSEVWQALLRIPFGQTRTYGAIAAELGRPHAARAVGAANGQNPFCIVVPCHRLTGADGRLVDYAAGLEVKRDLLAHEARVTGAQLKPRVAASRRSRAPSPPSGSPGNPGSAPPSAEP
ncbi:MAG TPA: methylated-DNA--[protein]-cysteine S-methyltransferase [Solirubrobacteraceae bacterium]|jgi:methylated-DNA-[protein]-cysteine S-methyltransferase